MKVIAEKIWNEPSVAIGLLASALLLVLNIAGHTEWSAQEIIEVAAPFIASLGIRQAVVPTNKVVGPTTITKPNKQP